MKEKKQIIISLRALIFFIALIIICGITVYWCANNLIIYVESTPESISDAIDINRYEGKDYYIIKNDYAGEYDLQHISLSQYYGSLSNNPKLFEKKEIMNYSEYKTYCKEWGLKKKYSDSSKNYIIFSYVAYNSSLVARLGAVDYINNNVNLYIWDDASEIRPGISAYCIVVPTEKAINNINIIGLYTNYEFYNIKNHGTTSEPTFNPNNMIPNDMNIDKPVIYLYPTITTEISVKLLKPELITCSYPKYIDEWNVLAKPNGDLTYLSTGRSLYALYYESKTIDKFHIAKEGFIVKGEDSAKFLEEKLATLGLNERESEEFIIYWLPQLESNKYNYIRFATDEEINNNMPLEISPKPDTIIRVLMIFKGLKKPIEVEEQKLKTPIRKGFTLVEWGGTEIK